MPKYDVQLKVEVAWWLKPYLAILVLCAVLSNRVPDQAKLERVIKRAMRIKVE